MFELNLINKPVQSGLIAAPNLRYETIQSASVLAWYFICTGTYVYEPDNIYIGTCDTSGFKDEAERIRSFGQPLVLFLSRQMHTYGHAVAEKEKKKKEELWNFYGLTRLFPTFIALNSARC